MFTVRHAITHSVIGKPYGTQTKAETAAIARSKAVNHSLDIVDGETGKTVSYACHGALTQEA